MKPNMIVKKMSEEITYLQKRTEHTFEVNGKKVHVYALVIDGEGESDTDVEIDEKDLATLNEDEDEVFGEDLNEWLDMKVGDETEVETSI